jgi:hypothetical protein
VSQQANIIKINHSLPLEVVNKFATLSSDTATRNAYMKALRDNKWSLQSIADAVINSGTGTFSRERVRQIVEVEKSSTSSPSVSSFPLPTPPLKPVKEPRVFAEPSDKTLSRLIELQPYAQQVRSHSAKYREEAEEYTALLNYAHTVEGVSIFRLAKRLKVTHGALRFRLARYGYLTGYSSNSTCYKPILDKNRFVLKS